MSGTLKIEIAHYLNITLVSLHALGDAALKVYNAFLLSNDEKKKLLTSSELNFVINVRQKRTSFMTVTSSENSLKRLAKQSTHSLQHYYYVRKPVNLAIKKNR